MTNVAEATARVQDRCRRAVAAYWRSPGATYPHPPEHAIYIEHIGLEYIQLTADATGPLAVYRVRNDGQLKRLRRPPDFSFGVRVIGTEEV